MTEIQTHPVLENIQNKGFVIELSPADDEKSRINGYRDTESKQIYIGEMDTMPAIGVACHEAGHNASEVMFFTTETEGPDNKDSHQRHPLTYEEANSATINLDPAEEEMLKRALQENLTTDDIFWEEDTVKSIIAKLVDKYTRGNYTIDPAQINFTTNEEVERRALGPYYEPVKSGKIKEAVVQYSRERRNSEAAAMQVEHGCMTVLENTLRSRGLDYTYTDTTSDSPSHDRAAALVNRMWKRGCMIPSELDFKRNSSQDNSK